MIRDSCERRGPPEKWISNGYGTNLFTNENTNRLEADQKITGAQKVPWHQAHAIARNELFRFVFNAVVNSERYYGVLDLPTCVHENWQFRIIFLPHCVFFPKDRHHSNIRSFARNFE